MKPLIIISPSINESEDEIKLSRACFDAVGAAGGFGAAVNYTDIDEIIETADGILLSGGGDIEPSLTEICRIIYTAVLYAQAGINLSWSL